MENQEPVYVGIDWATQKHDVCVVDEAGKLLGERQFPHSGKGLVSLLQWLLAFVDGCTSRLRLAIEVDRGPVVETLMARGVAIFSINPKQLDRFRDRFTVSGAKDDRLDAKVLAHSLRTDSHLYRRVKVVAANVIELREWSRMAEGLKKERVRLGNQIAAQLARYYPQMLELTSCMTERWLCALWKLVPTPEKAQRVRLTTVERHLKKHRKMSDASRVLAILKEPAVTVAPGTTEAATTHIKLLLERLSVVERQLHHIDRLMDQTLAQWQQAPNVDETHASGNEDGAEHKKQRDVEILLSLPGLGRTNLAALLSEASEAIAQRDYQRLRTFSGIAPVTRRSGKSISVIQRRACHPRVREAVYHWSRVAMIRDPLCRAKYKALRARGCTHGRALRSIGDRLLSVACAMLRTRTMYDPTRVKVAA